MTDPPSFLTAAGVAAPEDLYRCVHCGFCLPDCPTYIETGLETASPRGRLTLMKAVHEGRLDLTPRVQEHLELCVQCRACEAVCPSGVPFGRVMESARAQIVARRSLPWRQRLARVMAFQVVLPRPWLLRALAWLIRSYQISGVQWAVREYRLLRVVRGLDRMERQLPRFGRFFTRPPRAQNAGTGIATGGARKGTRNVALLTGCVMPLAFGRIHEATCRVLARNGALVTVPRGQVCCGALHAHSGDLDGARALARRNIDAFLAQEPDVVVINSAGCGAAVKDYPDLLQGDDTYREKARRLAGLAQDINQYLAALPFEIPSGAVDRRVTYQDSCHLAHAQRIKDAPRTILRSIPQLRFIEMAGSDICCGAGGIYALTHGDMSAKLLGHKLEHVADTGAGVVATANPGCLIQLEAGLRDTGAGTRVMHVVELLDEAYRNEGRQS